MARHRSSSHPHRSGGVLPQLPPTDLRYFVRILQELDHLLPAAGLTFFLTWHLDDFHEAMDDAIVLMVGDEQNQTPAFHRRVRVIYKTGGIRRSPLREILRLPASLAWRILLRDARDWAIQVKRRLNGRLRGHLVTPMYEIPYGPGALTDIDPLPIGQRPVDVFFYGGTAPGWTLRTKFIARRQLAAAVEAARVALPQYRMELRSGDRAGEWLSCEAYTQALANTKIALSPRGNCDAETYRIFEAAKLGCVIVSEPLPSRWYYRECPVISIPAWSALPEVLTSLLNDPARLAQLSLRTRQWWDSMVSEAALAKFIAQNLAEKDPGLHRG